MSNKMALDALTAAQRAINSMKVEAETAGAGGDQEMLQDACEQISNEGLAADTAIRAAIAALQEPQGWGPIETAPKDGSTYLVADAVRGMVAPHIRGVIHNNPGTAHDWQYGEAATHWMPLPTPPKD